MSYPEEYIDSRLIYRVGCPKLPMLPVQTRIRPNPNLETYIPNFSYHRRNIANVLAKYRIPNPRIFFHYRVNYDAVPTDEDLTLSITSTYSDGCQDQWIKAVKEVRKSLVEHELYWKIELLDYAVFIWPLETSPILSTDHDLIEGWSKVCGNFLSIIKDRDWVSVDVLYREFPSRKPQPTVILSARDANNDDWNVTLTALNELLQAYNVEVDVVLLYHKGLPMMSDNPTSFRGFEPQPLVIRDSSPDLHAIWNSHPDPRNERDPDHDDIPGSKPDPLISKSFYEDSLQMGTSCAKSESDSSGTLGGRIKLQGEGSLILELGLTNYHVMKDAFQDQGWICRPFPPISASEDLYGIVASPSKNDHKRIKRDSKKDLSRTEGLYKELAQKLEYLTADDSSWERMKLRTDYAFSQYRTAEMGLEIVNMAPHSIGHIYAASGFRTCENMKYPPGIRQNWALDWCLIKLDQPLSISNRLENVSATAFHVAEETAVTQYCSIDAKNNHKVIKRGRTTGWTKGTISAINSIVRLEAHREIDLQIPTYQKADFRDKWGGSYVFVHPIIGTRQIPEFIKPGDSGSFILLDQKNMAAAPIVGLGFSGNDASLASYMIPMDLVVKDIEAVTGMKVIEPEYLGEAKQEAEEEAEEEARAEPSAE